MIVDRYYKKRCQAHLYLSSLCLLVTNSMDLPPPILLTIDGKAWDEVQEFLKNPNSLSSFFFVCTSHWAQVFQNRKLKNNFGPPKWQNGEVKVNVLG